MTLVSISRIGTIEKMFIVLRHSGEIIDKKYKKFTANLIEPTIFVC